MATLITTVAAEGGEAARAGVKARVWELEGYYVVGCNGAGHFRIEDGEDYLSGHRGPRQECPQTPDTLIELGDTWETEESAVRMAHLHVAGHERLAP